MFLPSIVCYVLLLVAIYFGDAVATALPALASIEITTWVWFLLVGRIGAVRASTFHFLNPFLGVLIAAGFLGEAIGPLDVLGVVIIAGGILAVQLSKQIAPATLAATNRDPVAEPKSFTNG